MIWTPLDVTGCYSTCLNVFSDDRGAFQKLFHADTFDAIIPGFVPRETYLTTSHKGVLRGMHFQLPPHDHAKIVVCLSGSATDVMVDVRGTADFGKTTQVALTPDGTNCVAMKTGIAHGFYAHADNTQLLYLVGSCHAPEADTGVSWDSIGFDWPTQSPILSVRDTKHPSLSDFTPPKNWTA